MSGQPTKLSHHVVRLSFPIIPCNYSIDGRKMFSFQLRLHNILYQVKYGNISADYANGKPDVGLLQILAIRAMLCYSTATMRSTRTVFHHTAWYVHLTLVLLKSYLRTGK